MQTQYNEAYGYGYNDGFRAAKVEMDVLREQLAECKESKDKFIAQYIETTNVLLQMQSQLECIEKERDEHLRNWNRVVEERMAVEKERDMLVDALKMVSKIECVDDLWKAQAALAKLSKTGEMK